MNRTCSRCDEPLVADARFCSICGAQIPPLVEEPTPGSPVTGTIHSLGMTPDDSGPLPAVLPADLASVKPGSQVLVIVRGPNMGLRLDLVGNQMVAGRSPDTAIFLDDITVSRQHARFELAGDTWTLVDLGSLNGTYVNKNRIDKVPLKTGDEIQIGKYRFRYLASDDTATSAPGTTSDS